jgi:hypothetical protein
VPTPAAPTSEQPDPASGGVGAAEMTGLPVTGDEVLAFMRHPRWVADRDAVLTLVALRGLPTPPLYSPEGYSMTGLTLWHEHPSSATPPDAVRHMFDYWHGESSEYWRMREHVSMPVSITSWQIVVYGIAHDYLLPAMNATHYRLAFHPTKNTDNPVRATVARPHHSDPISYATMVYIPWPELLARLVATINAVERITHHPAGTR